MKRITPIYTTFARKLRKDQTEVEKILWHKLRNRQLENIKFRRQYSIGPYIVDFVATETKVIIELDGGQHNEESNRIKDEERTHYLEKNGYKLIRFWDNEVMENLDEVLESISKAAFYH